MPYVLGAKQLLVKYGLFLKIPENCENFKLMSWLAFKTPAKTLIKFSVNVFRILNIHIIT